MGSLLDGELDRSIKNDRISEISNIFAIATGFIRTNYEDIVNKHLETTVNVIGRSDKWKVHRMHVSVYLFLKLVFYLNVRSLKLTNSMLLYHLYYHLKKFSFHECINETNERS